MAQSPFGVIQKELLAHKVVRQITLSIKNGYLKQGDRLPSERELAVQMGVGRPAIREALRALQLLKIVEVRHGDGTYVASPGQESLAEAYDVLLSVGGVTLGDLFEARRLLEVAVAALAAERVSDELVEELRRCVQAAKDSITDPYRFLELDMRLHSLILEAAENPVLKSLMAGIQHLLRESRELTVHLPGVREMVVRDHHRIAEAIASRDPVKSAAVMDEHLDRIQSAALSHVSGNGRGGEVPSGS